MSPEMVTLDRTAPAHGEQTPRRGAVCSRLPTVAEVMTRHPVTVGEHASLFRAWGLLRDRHGEHVVVVDEAARPIGVLDERDIVLEWPPGPLGAHHLPVHQLLRFRPPSRAHRSDHIATAALTMLSAGAGALPVVDEDGRLAGLVTARHCVELIAFMHHSDDATPHALPSARPGTSER